MKVKKRANILKFNDHATAMNDDRRICIQMMTNDDSF